MKETEEKVDVKICKQFSTSGYSLNVNKVVEKDGIYYVYLSIIPPKQDVILMQVISYKIVNIEINKKYLKTDPPYIFKIRTNPLNNIRLRNKRLKEC